MEKTMDILKTEAEIGKLMAETIKLNAEAAKFNRERYWYPVVVTATIIGASVAATKLFLH
ncbi:hypothetical protein [Xylophilus ampelinus]|uniref:Uncharacterized protein n=1 Tax=Xylophilus ampelinus TaxID=54067 RepID=A0A318SKA2_9BURK|nr:hypothetical protein [Xylophilus ampelinus]MCS4508873.1 hypothetical protein [Xylophilus ampelinus]PYE79444.1 hypothetical protein DFQ15_102177 [Xylophilus ampelinus]